MYCQAILLFDGKTLSSNSFMSVFVTKHLACRCEGVRYCEATRLEHRLDVCEVTFFVYFFRKSKERKTIYSFRPFCMHSRSPRRERESCEVDKLYLISFKKDSIFCTMPSKSLILASLLVHAIWGVISSLSEALRCIKGLVVSMGSLTITSNPA